MINAFSREIFFFRKYIKMAYRKKRGIPKRRPARRRPAYRRRRRIPRPMRNWIHQGVFRIQDSQTAAEIFNQVVSGSPVTSYGHISWQLDMFPQHGCYTRMYNQYKINKIKVEFIPVNTRAQITDGNVGADSNVPTFGCFVNRTSTSFPVNLNQVLSVPGAKQVNCGRYVTQYFSPVTYDSVYRPLPATSNALNPEYGQWLRTSEANVPHHGVSWVVSQAGSNWAEKSFQYRLVVTIYCQFKGLKVDTSV